MREERESIEMRSIPALALPFQAYFIPPANPIPNMTAEMPNRYVDGIIACGYTFRCHRFKNVIYVFDYVLCCIGEESSGILT